MANLFFRPDELLSEIEALRQLCAGFLAPDSFQLQELAGDIRGLKEQKSGRLTLEIPEDRPLMTKPSEGQFERAPRSSGRSVVAKVTGKWDVKIVKTKVPDQSRPNKKARELLLLDFVDRASTVIHVVDEGGTDPIACWKMELGISSSPGCFFHTFASGDANFPVPRHPNLFPTPMSAIGFVLGELFQDEWEQEVSKAGFDPPQRWRSIQSRRLLALFAWQMELAKAATASPWYAIKAGKPLPSIFL
ncbi:MAG: hypothetical protein RLO52_08785 [Sandaracinaceae bacterium]